MSCPKQAISNTFSVERAKTTLTWMASSVASFIQKGRDAVMPSNSNLSNGIGLFETSNGLTPEIKAQYNFEMEMANKVGFVPDVMSNLGLAAPGTIEDLVSESSTTLNSVKSQSGSTRVFPQPAGCSSGACGLSSDIVRRVGKNIGVGTEVYQAVNIPRGLANGGESFSHAFNVARVGQQPYIVDLTYGQFVPEGGGFLNQGSHLVSSVDSSSPLVRQLLTKGYAPMTEGNLNIYLQSLSSRSISKVATNVFDSVVPLEADYSAARFAKFFTAAGQNYK
jgi:hypothetical protein